VRAAARWVVLRGYFIELGAAMMRVKDAAGVPQITLVEKQLLREFHRNVAKNCDVQRDAQQTVQDSPGNSTDLEMQKVRRNV
jgi:hypothetical protein